MLEICKQLFDNWNDNVTYCHWKGNEPRHLEKGLNGESDMDVLLSNEDMEKGHEILQSLRYVQCKSQFGSRYPNVEDWIGFDQETGKLVHLHLHFSIITGHDGLKEFNLPWCKEALESRIYDKSTGIYIMNPNLELITLYTRICLKSKAKHVIKALVNRYNIKTGFKKDPTEEITYLKSQVDWNEVDKILYNYYPQNKQEFLKQTLRQTELDSSSFLSLLSINLKSMRKSSRYNYLSLLFIVPFYSFILHVIGRMKSHKIGCFFYRKIIWSGKGLSIAFLGQDGSGKSTVTNDIRKWLTWKFETHTFYFGSGDQYNTWAKSLNTKIKGNTFVKKIIKKILTIYIYARWGGYITKLNKKALKYISKGGIAIYDRFPQMQYLGINDGPKIRTNVLNKTNTKILRPLIEYFCRKEENAITSVTKTPPSIVIKLLLSPEESIRRKPFEKYENVKQKHEIIKNLKFDKSSVYEIDATQKYDIELITIKSIIWNHLLTL